MTNTAELQKIIPKISKMEAWQRKAINKWRPQLIEHIEYNVFLINYLLSDGIISYADREEIEARGNMYGHSSKIDNLLGRLEKRIRGYESLSQALYKGKQTGALFILLQGAEEYQPECNPFQICGIEINTDIVCSKDVIFEGVKLPLKTFCNFLGEASFNTIVRNSMDVLSYKNLILNTGACEYSLATSTIPDPISNYIERSLCQKNELKPDIFTKLRDDVYLIEGMKRYQLTKLATETRNLQFKSSKQQPDDPRSSKRHQTRYKYGHGTITTSRDTIMEDLTDVSSNQLHCINVRFILLEESSHFYELESIGTHILHWIKHENGSFYYVKSSKNGGIRKIRKFVGGKENSITEDKFLSQCLHSPKNQPVLIYDTPGMGKTTLLKELARKVKLLKPQSNVIFLTMSEFIELFKETATLSNDTFKEKLTQKLSTGKLARALQAELFKSSQHSIELFLDSFDELNKKDVKFAVKVLLFTLQNLRNVRMYVATRPQYGVDLEDTFGVLGYSILPFQEADQVAFIVKFWKTHFNIQDEDNTKAFAKYCLQKFAFNLSSRDKHLAGIPMQCSMLAEIFGPYAKNKNPKMESSRHSLNSIYNVFKDFIQAKFEKLSECSNDQLNLYEFHTVSAMQLLFPEQLTLAIPLVDLDKVYSIGIMEYNLLNPSKPKFVHRSFAEYLAGECLVEWLQGGFPESCSYDRPFITFLINDVFVRKNTFKFGNICGKQFSNLNIIGFFDRSMAENSNIMPISVMSQYAADDNFTYTTFIDLLKASLAQNSNFLFEFILDTFLHIDQPRHCSWRDGNIFDVSAVSSKKKFKLIFNFTNPQNKPQDILCIATKLCSVSLVKLACQFLFRVTGKRFYEFKYIFKTSPLYNAFRRGKYQIVEYFVSNCESSSYIFKCLPLHCCMEQSYYTKDKSVISEKVEIIHLILDKFPQLVHQQNVKSSLPPILSYEAHPELIKVLIEAEADIFAVTSEQRNIAHLTAEYFTVEEYHNLIELLISLEISKGMKIVSKLFNAYSSNPMCTAVCTAVFNIELLPTTITTLKSQYVNFNKIDNMGSSILHVAVGGKRSVEFIIFLIENQCCSITEQDNNGNTFLHNLPESYSDFEYYEIVKFLCSQGYSNILLIRNQKSCQPLHTAVTHMNITEITLNLLQSNGVNLKSEEYKTLLIIAAKSKRSVNTLKALVNAGIDVLVEDSGESTLAHIIADRYSPEEFHEMTEYFIQNGFGQMFRKANKYEETPLHLAVENFEVLSQTLDLLTGHHGAKLVDWNAVDEYGNTILHNAVDQERSLDFIKELVQRGVDAFIKDYHNFSLAHESASSGLLEHLRYFVELGCDINVMDDDGDDVLHCVLEDARKNVHEMVEFLVLKGANINGVNSNGRTAYMIAIEKGISDERILNMLK